MDFNAAVQSEEIMSDLDNLNALKRMLEHKDEEEAKNALEKEKKFIADATKAYMGEHAVQTGIQAYTPADMIAFLSLPTAEVQSRMGGEWTKMDKMAFEAFTYTMKQKIQKSASLIDWK